MRFSGVNSFILAVKELEKVGLNPLFKYSEVRKYFNEIGYPIAKLDAVFYFEDFGDIFNIIFFNKEGKDVLILELKKES